MCIRESLRGELADPDSQVLQQPIYAQNETRSIYPEILNIYISSLLNGDINQDGNCNVQDIILMINHIIETTLLSEAQIYLADMNNDGTVDIMDIIMVINIIIER